MNKLRRLLERLRSSLWFVPTLLVSGAVALAIGLVEAEDRFGAARLAEDWPRLFGAGAAGARGLLESIAGSMITVAGVTFSITIVALTLASTQYSPRILRNFMRDRANQTVLGVFLGIYAYCLVVLRTIRGGDDDGLFVPSLAVLFGLALAFVAIGVLIFFIHHMATAIQATTILEAASDETLQAIDRLFPAELGQAADAGQRRDAAALAASTWIAVPSRRSGFIQDVDPDALLAFAREHDVLVRMERGVGEFVVEAQPLVSVAGTATVDDAMSGALDAAFSIDRQRTVDQDPGFGIRQIVDIALKALSPGVNDTTTAINSIDHLSVILSRLAARRIESEVRADDAAVRVLARGPSFASLLGEAIDQIRQNADANVAVLCRLLEVLGVVAQRTSDPERRRLLREHADLMVETSERSVPAAVDRARVQRARAQSSA